MPAYYAILRCRYYYLMLRHADAIVATYALIFLLFRCMFFFRLFRGLSLMLMPLPLLRHYFLRLRLAFAAAAATCCRCRRFRRHFPACR